MNILIVSFDYTPKLSPQAFRWAPISQELARRGHTVTVVAGWEPGCERHECGESVNVYRVGGKLIERVRIMLTRKQEESYKSTHHTRVSKGALHVFLRCLKLIHDVTWKRVYWPDAHCLWLFSALRRATKIVKSSQIDAVVTVGFPFTCHLVGLGMKSKYPRLPWISDLSDPFSYLEPSPPNNRALYGKLNCWLERQVLERSDWMVARYTQMASRYSELYPGSREKIVVVPDLHIAPLNNANCIMHSRAELGRKQGRKLMYAGTLDGRIRDPRPFLDACRRMVERYSMSDLEVHLYGKIENCDAIFDEYQAFYNRWLFVHGLVDQSVALKAVQEADVLVNIGNKFQCQTPSKLVDYGSTGNPILNIVGCPTDLSIGALCGYNAALHLVSSNGTLSDAQISEMSSFLRTQRALTADEVSEWMKRFTLSTIVSSYEHFLNTRLMN